jgi:hypothetical protein
MHNVYGGLLSTNSYKIAFIHEIYCKIFIKCSDLSRVYRVELLVELPLPSFGSTTGIAGHLLNNVVAYIRVMRQDIPAQFLCLRPVTFTQSAFLPACRQFATPHHQRDHPIHAPTAHPMEFSLNSLASVSKYSRTLSCGIFASSSANFSCIEATKASL